MAYVGVKAHAQSFVRSAASQSICFISVYVTVTDCPVELKLLVSTTTYFHAYLLQVHCLVDSEPDEV